MALIRSACVLPERTVLTRFSMGSTSDNNVAVGHEQFYCTGIPRERDTMKTSEFPDIVRLKNNNVHKQNVDLHFHRLNQQ